jgi:hypothetical protein
MRTLLHFAAVLLSVLLTICSAVYAQQNIIINGTVTGTPNNNLIENVKVVAVNLNDGLRMDSTLTNEAGHYVLDFQWTGAEVNGAFTNKLFPVPYASKTQLEFNAGSSVLDLGSGNSKK